MKKVLITGSGGLIGSEAVRFFCERGFEVVGLDNDGRRYFFGPTGSTTQNSKQLVEQYKNFSWRQLDIRAFGPLKEVFQTNKFDLIIHTAAQPSHDWAQKEPLTDFTVNANGTLNVLECTRLFAPEAVVIFTSTNKVYGDRPNYLPLLELDARYDLPADHQYYRGIDESMSIDNCLHSLFGASKVAADVVAQEYGKYFGLKVGIFRGGCITGSHHQGVELHGFLSYLTKCVVTGQPYTIYGYKGKQVRDNIDAADLVNAFYHFYLQPRPGEVYNMGGSRYNHSSLLETISLIESISGRKANYTYSPQARIGDHQWYVSDVSKFKTHFPNWQHQHSLEDVITSIVRNLATI